MKNLELRLVTDGEDPVIGAFGALQNHAYFEPEMLIPASYIARMLEWQTPQRRNFLLVAESDGRLLGGSVFHLFVDLNVGFSSFLAVDPSARGRGVARALHEGRLAALDAAAGQRVQGVFIDVVHPQRLTAAQHVAERDAQSDPVTRRRVFQQLGFRQVDIRYEQPVGGPGGGPVTNMDLLFCPREARETIPTRLVVETMRTYWTPWMGEQWARRHARELEERAHGQTELALLPTLPAALLGETEGR